MITMISENNCAGIVQCAWQLFPGYQAKTGGLGRRIFGNELKSVERKPVLPLLYIHLTKY
jgi:hypothetical protein